MKNRLLSIPPHSDDKLMLNAFDCMRFPLIIGVLFIHNFKTTVYVGGSSVDVSEMPLLYYAGNLFSEVLGRISVPLFFLMSGYLFFYKVETFDSAVYLRKLRSRCRTLLIPYMFWVGLFLAIHYLISLYPSTSLNRPDYTLGYVLSAFWGLPNADATMAYPVVYQFWFIRDLIVCVVLSPLIYFGVTKCRHLFVALLGLAWVAGWEIPYIGMWGFRMSALFFFSLGAWCSVHEKNLVVMSRNLKFFGFAYPVIALADLLTKGMEWNRYVNHIGILCGIILCFILTAYFLYRGKLKAVPLLSSASFFVFAIHDPWLLSSFRRAFASVLRVQTDFAFTVLYFMEVVLAAGVALGIYCVLKKMMPKTLSFISGGR